VRHENSLASAAGSERLPPRQSGAGAARAGMDIDRLLQITFATLVSLGTMLLGMGQRSLTLPLVAILAAAASIYVTDLRGWIRLNRPVANLAALLAVVFSVSNFFYVSSEDQLLAVANLLVYLQVVLMFQKKTGRMYWQLLVLNVLQVVVGAALDLDMLFGLLLVVYLFVTLAAMSLLFIHREAERWQRMGRGEGRGARGEERGDGDGRASHPIGAQRSAASSSLAPRPSPLAAIRVYANLPADPARELLGRGIFRRTLGIGMGTLIVAAVCFFSMPRFGRSTWAGGGSGRGSSVGLVGYSPTVKLGDLGPMLQNPELVMRITFRNEKTGESIVPTDPPLLRGSLVIQYGRGEWKHDLPARGKPRGESLAPPPPHVPLVRQQITLKPMPDEPVLFAVYPAFEANSEQPDRHILFDPERQQMVRAADVQGREFDYELLTTAAAMGGQGRIVPQPITMTPSELDELLALPDEIDPVDRLTGLRALAAKTIHDANLSAGDRYGKAKALELMLSLPPFEYSLDRPPPAPDVDPIEDFVTRNRSGHCEYFASALALMLRSQGIPARMVTGFHGGEWNALGSFLDVRQLHAHAWVEAYLEPDQIPAAVRPLGMSVRHGAWLVLDSTPGGHTASEVSAESWLSSLQDFGDYVAQLWNSYVVGLNTDRQERVVYQPLAKAGETIKGWWRRIELSAAGLADRIRHYWGRDETDQGEGSSTWPIFLLLAVLAVLMFAVYRILRRFVRAKSKRRRGSAGLRAGGGAELAFYRRFETLLARRGLVRRTGQTQLEFAQAAAAILPDASDGQPAGPLARRVVDAYYRVRFGRTALDSRQAAAVEQLLDRLQTAVARPPKRGARR
jgi:protein-glutamine gamma-glutamyltransferase